ncbi:MAG: hypothetical protein U0075_24535 [Thermomicrobiales bacterium]
MSAQLVETFTRTLGRRCLATIAVGGVATALGLPRAGTAARKDRKRTVCLNGKTKRVSKSRARRLARRGATRGACTCLRASQDLRAAILAAAPGSSLTLCPGTWPLDEESEFAPAVTISKALTLIGAGSSRTVIEGDRDRASGFSFLTGIRIAPGAVVRLEALSVRNYCRTGIVNEGDLTLVGVAILANGCPDQGESGIDNYGMLTLQDCTVAHNGSAHSGGGVANAGTATVIRSSVTGNGVAGPSNPDGGGIENQGEMTLIDSTVTDNHAGNGGGGGIANSGTLVLVQSHVSGNGAGWTDMFGNQLPGGIFNSGSVELTDGSSVTDNSPTNCLGSPTPVAGCLD